MTTKEKTMTSMEKTKTTREKPRDNYEETLTLLVSNTKTRRDETKRCVSTTDKRFFHESQQANKTHDTDCSKLWSEASLPQPPIFHGVCKATLQRAHPTGGQAAKLAIEKCEAGVHVRIKRRIPIHTEYFHAGGATTLRDRRKDNKGAQQKTPREKNKDNNGEDKDNTKNTTQERNERRQHNGRTKTTWEKTPKNKEANYGATRKKFFKKKKKRGEKKQERQQTKNTREKNKEDKEETKTKKQKMMPHELEQPLRTCLERGARAKKWNIISKLCNQTHSQA